MDEIDRARTSVESSPDEVPSSGGTRNAFVTCDGRTAVDSNAVLATVASFLKEKVFPVVSDHCMINLHWDGTDLATLHVRSVVPDSHVLVPRVGTSASSGAALERVASSQCFVREQGAVAALPSPPANITIKEEPIDVTDELIIAEHEIKQELNIDQDDGSRSSDDGKFDLGGQMVDTENDILNVPGNRLVDDKQYDDFRPKPPAPPMPPPGLSGAAFPMYLPQSSVIPMIPVMAFGQSQLSYQQITPMLLSPMPTMPTMPQLPIQSFQQLMPGYGEFLQSPFGMQPVTLPLPQQHQTSPDPNSVLLRRNGSYM